MPFRTDKALAKYKRRPHDLDHEGFEARAEECRTCPHRIAMKCGKLDELISIIARRPSQLCPDYRWPGSPAPAELPEPAAVPQWIQDYRQASATPRKLRVACLLPVFCVGGLERFMIGLVKHAETVEWVGIAFDDYSATITSTVKELAQYVPLYASPLESPDHRNATEGLRRMESGEAAVQAAVRDADVVYIWGFDVRKYAHLLQGKRVVLMSHGSCAWTASMLAANVEISTDFVCVANVANVFPQPIRNRVKTLLIGAEVERCAPTRPREVTRAEWGFSQADALVGFVGRISFEKRPLAGADAAKALGPGWHAVYVGRRTEDLQEGQSAEAFHMNPQNQEDFLRNALAASDGRAKVFPAVRHVGDAYAALDVLLLASENEGFGLVIAEAWLAGLPVVCTGVGIVREIEQEVGSLVTRIEHDSPPTVIAAAIREALSPAGRVMAQKARKIAWDRFTAAAMAHRWEAHLCSLPMPS